MNISNLVTVLVKPAKIYFANFDSVASLYGVDSTCASVENHHHETTYCDILSFNH